MSRAEVELLVKLPHEVADAASVLEPEATTMLQERIDARGLPEAYTQHPIVRDTADMVMPWGIYMDALPYSLVDSVLGVWLINVVTNTRYIIALVRKRLTCKCGCKGWCTCWPLLKLLHWSIRAMSEGISPASRHDGRPWEPADGDRFSAAGSPLRMRGAIIRLKGDWAELCERLGFPTWASGLRPCFCCAAAPDDFYTTVGVSLVDLPWHVNTPHEYDEACARCEVWVDLTDDTRDR